MNRPAQLKIGEWSVSLRYDAMSSDREVVREIVESTRYFHAHEVDIAVELVDERLRRGDESGYHFVFASVDGRTLAYACYGPIACTVGSYDLYWIAVRPDCQGRGLGQALVALTESLIQMLGGKRIYVETSGRPDYLPTRRFYERCQYQKSAELPDFYDHGDPKVIYVKRLDPT